MMPPRAPRRFAALAVLVSLSCLAAAPARDLFDEIYAKGRGVEASIKTVSARFTETTTTSMLSKPLVAHGTLAVIRPSKIALHYTDPEPRIVLIDGNQMTMTWPSRAIEQHSDIAAAQKRIDKYFLDKSPDELRRAFKIAARVATDHPNTWQVTMDPTRSQIQQGLKRLTLWIDRTSMLLTAMQFDFPNGDRKLMTFEDVVVNGRMDEGMFRVR